MTEMVVGKDLAPLGGETAAMTRDKLARHGVLAVNLMGSPGSGKTALLEATLSLLADRARAAIITADIETSADADRLAPHGVPVIQVNTGPFGGACHLPPEVFAQTLERLDLATVDVLFIENVGNLVCPAEFDLGEDHKVVVLSVTEGEDKPLKYPLAFHEAALVVVTKMDLLPHLPVDRARLAANLRRANPSTTPLFASSFSGEGMAEWVAWVENALTAKRQHGRKE